MNTSQTRARRTRTRRWIGAAAVPVAVLIAGGLVWQSSNAAFTATTRNAGNSWSTGQVTLTDDDKGVAGFTVEDLTPGATGSRCITVTSRSTVPGEVRAYVQNLAPSAQGLENHITLLVERGTGGSFADCAGFAPSPGALPAQSLATLAQVNKDYSTGGAAWDVAGTGDESTTYRGTWTFDTAGMTQGDIDALQGARTSVDLVWELQTTDAP